MRVAVFGTGGVGGFFGGKLAAAGESVTFIARGDHLRAIVSDGLRIDTPDGELLIRPDGATDDPVSVGPVDVVLVGVKAWQLEEAAKAVRPMVGPATMVVPLQNGVEARQQLATMLGEARVISGLCGTFSWITGPGRIRNIGSINLIRFGEIDNRKSNRVEKLEQAFERSGVTVEVPNDIEKALWDKFLLITSFGGIGAVTRAPIGVIRTVPETRQLLRDCVAEVVAVARARKVALADTAVADTMAFLDKFAPEGTTSMQRDITQGRKSELEAWNGAVVRLGREAGVPTPLNAFIYHALLPLERRARGALAFQD
jgi:2-dehydropantoate 2-reductase